MSDVPAPHRREFSRVAVQLRAEVTVGGIRLPEGAMEQLSLKGGYFRSTAAPAPGSRCEIRLHLDGSDITVHTEGHIVRCMPGGCAIQFDEVVGVDSLEHLRNLILYNAEDPAKVEQEFHDHLGLKRDG